MIWVSDRAVSRLRAVANWPEFAGPRYAVEREIGRGGMGTVFLGTDASLDRAVAIKVTNAPAAGSPLEARMRNEARVLADLEHPGIVPVHDVGTLADGRLFAVMKLVRGVTLAEHLAVSRDLPERLRIFERIIEPVAFAHARGYVHRDLKPSNVMVGAFGEVLVMDWGVAKRLGDPVAGDADRRGADGGRPGEAGDTDPGTVLGTPGYMAPEQRAGRAVDQRADVHALGGILFAMLTGAPPPEAPDGDVATLLARRREVPKRLRAVCARAMATDPADRYAGAEELAADIARYRSGLPVLAYPETVLERAGRVAWKYRTPLLLVLAYLVTRAIIAVIFRR